MFHRAKAGSFSISRLPHCGLSGTKRLLMLTLVLVVAGGCSTQTPVWRLAERGDWHRQYERYDEAAEQYRQIIEQDAGNWEAQYQLGVCCIHLNQLEEGRRALEIANTIRPHHEGVTEALAETMYRQGDENHLFAFLRSKAEAATGHRSQAHATGAYLRLGRFAQKMGDSDAAKVAYDTAIAMDQGLGIEPYLSAADFAQRIGDQEMAFRRLRQAYGLDPHDTRVHERLMAMGEVPGPTLALPPGR